MSSYSNRIERVAPLPRLNPRFPLRFSERRILLIVVDLLGLNVALLLVLFAFTQPETPIFAWAWQHQTWFLLLSVFWLLAAPLWDGYDLVRAASPNDATWSAAGAALVVSGLYWLVLLLPLPLPLPRRIYILTLPLLSALGIGLWRLLYATLFTQPAFQQTALVIGAGCSGAALVRALREPDSDRPCGVGYRILGFIDDDEAKQARASPMCR